MLIVCVCVCVCVVVVAVDVVDVDVVGVDVVGVDFVVVVAVVCMSAGMVTVGRDVSAVLSVCTTCRMGACLCVLWYLRLCVVPVSVKVGMCLWACVLWTGLGV